VTMPSVAVDVDASDGMVTITVRDDGVGFDPAARAIRERRLGLTSMRERAEALGGTLTVETAPRAGTAVRVEVPGG
jgi:signal transduction histidine kinase